MAYRATRDEPRVAVGEWTKDLHKGSVLPAAAVPDSVADYLMDQGVLIEVPEGTEDNPWFDSDDPELANAGKVSNSKRGK